MEAELWRSSSSDHKPNTTDVVVCSSHFTHLKYEGFRHLPICTFVFCPGSPLNKLDSRYIAETLMKVTNIASPNIIFGQLALKV
jgi:hypothetical protein